MSTPQPAATRSPDFAEPGRPVTLRAAVWAVLLGMAVLLVFGSGPLRDYMSYLPLWMDPVGLWLMDAATTWHDWMTAIGANRPHEWVSATIDEVRMAGAPG